MFKILAILDDRAGNNTQVMGIANRLAEQLGAKIITKIAKYNLLAKLPYLPMKNRFYSVKNKEDFEVKADLVITAGRRAAVIGYIHQKSFQSKWIGCMWSGNIGKYADALILPYHDKERNIANIIRFLGAPNNFSISQAEAESENFEFGKIAQSKLACLIGGSHKSGVFSNKMALDLSHEINNVANSLNAYPMVTVSRRTGKSQSDIIRTTINEPKYFYDLKGENPYKAILYHADYIVVTSDSISMISEAIATQKPVMIFDRLKLSGRKHKKFIANLIEHNYVTYLGNSLDNLKKVDLMKDLIEEIIRKLHLLD